ncbi:MAG TPA: beta-ketoacyl synthase chain length factor [Chitinophagaceae bacterium]|nr:MAG: Beta-ketoacyl synthase [Bacteroidetes bacterium OLB11]HMN33113.1 beta-ketoacyl synthase chain length factor [Chitinophagaceae bacterium]
MKSQYIISISCISPQHTFESNGFFENDYAEAFHTNILYCKEANFKKYINPIQIRRMSRLLKMGYSVAVDCLEKVKDRKIDSVIFGTGKGSLSDTESFLKSIKAYQETALNPTQFIHSTYNQINGLVSLNKKIDSYNVTYVHKAFSFEHSLLDAMMLLEENAENVLVGAFEEITEEHFNIKKKFGFFKEENINSLHLFNDLSKGSIAGEGCTFFVLSNQKTKDKQAMVIDLKTLYQPNKESIHHSIKEILNQNNLSSADIDIILHGANGCTQQANHFEFFKSQFPQTDIIPFKQFCGEYDTAIQFAFWIATQILENQKVPSFFVNQEQQPIQVKKIRNILIYNNYFEINQSILLLSI